MTSPMTEMVVQQHESIGRLRVLVLVLGGGAHAKWWRSEFLTAAGLRFLERLYPRTSCAAAIRATSVAARELHDAGIGRGGVYHLFRLPASLEAQIHALAERGFFDQIIRELDLEASDSLVAQIEGLANDSRGAAPGPQRIGSVGDLWRGALVEKWAGAYLQAFRNNYRVFPYVEAEKSC